MWLVALLLSLNVHADQSSKQAFCEARLTAPNGVQALLHERSNHLAFYNGGGIGGAGVCWWHSRFTRNAAYGAFFRPDLDPADDAGVKRILKAIRNGRMVEVPGYRDLYEFSHRYSEEIQKVLDGWQLGDGVLRQQWVEGLRGGTRTTPASLKASMDSLYGRVSGGEVVYQVLQMPGVTAHAWLVVGMEPRDEGYVLTVVDSNQDGVTREYYSSEMEGLTYWNGMPFVPYVHKTDEEVALRARLVEYCRQ